MDRFRAVACVTTVSKLAGYRWLMTMKRMEMRILPDSFGERQQPATRSIQHLDSSRKGKGAVHPTLCSADRFEKAFDHVDRNQALKAMKEHGVDKQPLAWISRLLEQ